VPRYLEMIHGSAEDALGYIRRYLETQSGGRRAESDDVALLPEVFAWLEERYALQFDSRGACLRCSPPGDDARVAIDARVLRQVGENLLGNAMKYAPGGDVDLPPGAVPPASGRCWSKTAGRASRPRASANCSSPSCA
jgi:two-component system sensor histidine kinase/response regulator